MIDWMRRQILLAMRVPSQPEPPAGALGSVRIFRAGANFYKLRVLLWGGAQVGAVVGIFFSLWFLNGIDAAVSLQKDIAAQVQPQTGMQGSAKTDDAVTVATTPSKGSPYKRSGRNNLARKIADWPDWTVVLIHWAEYAAIAVFILQIPVTFGAVRLEYEQHWYIVTDRSLRIRTGLVTLQESTMSFANIQQVELRQGPLQRLLGIADVRVQSAGGGGGERRESGADQSMHSGVFQGVDNAHEIRDLILARLRRYRETGLGDPDDHHTAPESSTPFADSARHDATAAARELLAETRLLRRQFERPGV